MCFTNAKAIKKAEHDIIVYKAMNRNGKGKSCTSIHTYFKYRLGRKYKSKDSQLSKGVVTDKNFHSYNRIKDCVNNVYEGYLCIIPKGAYYCEGKENNNKPGYISDQIIILREIKK